MDIDTIVTQYRKSELNAQQALDLLQQHDLLAEALMRLLVNSDEDREALFSLCKS